MTSSDAEREKVLARLDALSRVTDTAFRVPFTRIRFGWDALIGLVPVVGDAISALLSLYLVWQAWRLKVGMGLIARMLLNVLIDFLIGLFPMVGDAADALFKVNLRNVHLLRDHLRAAAPQPVSPNGDPSSTTSATPPPSLRSQLLWLLLAVGVLAVVAVFFEFTEPGLLRGMIQRWFA